MNDNENVNMVSWVSTPRMPRPSYTAPETRMPAMPQPSPQPPAMPQPSPKMPAMPQPAQKMPAMPQPAQKMPAMPQPAQKMPAMPQPAQKMPAMQQPAQKMPAMQQPAQKMPAMQQPAQNMPAMQQSAQNMPAMPQPGTNAAATRMMANPPVYPETYYILQSYIMMVADKIEMYGDKMPSMDMLECMCDQIYDDVCRMYPELTDYARDREPAVRSSLENGPPAVEAQFIPRGFVRPGRFQRRGPFKSLIDILLLNELFRRRRRRHDWD